MRTTIFVVAVFLIGSHVNHVVAADFALYGRSGDAIEINFAALPGIAAGATYSGLNVSGFAGHTVLTSDTLSGQPFGSSGRLWVFANPAFDTTAEGDTNTAARGFQGTLSGSLLVNGATRTFSVQVQSGYTGNGATAVGQSLERISRAANNPLFVAEQQRLRYFSFVRDGGAALPVTGNFDAATDEATRTFQAAFLGGVNTTQADADGIIGPITAGWLNAANAPTWDMLVDLDPQTPGSFSLGGMIGNFDILPAPDPGTGNRTGLTPQTERFGTSWAMALIKAGSALAKTTTGRTQLINAISMADGYGSSCCHSTHLNGMDVDVHTDSSTWDTGDGTIDSEEQKAIQHAHAFIHSGSPVGVARILTSNQDILGGINALDPGKAVYDSTGGHLNHMHFDVAVPTQLPDPANLPGDFDLNDAVNAADYTIWRDGLDSTLAAADFAVWKSHFGQAVGGGAGGGAGGATSSVPEPASWMLFVAGAAVVARARRTFVSARRRGQQDQVPA